MVRAVRRFLRRNREHRPEYPYDDSNADPSVRSRVLSPLSYKGLVEYQGLEPCELSLQGTAGAQDHTPGERPSGGCPWLASPSPDPNSAQCSYKDSNLERLGKSQLVSQLAYRSMWAVSPRSESAH